MRCYSWTSYKWPYDFVLQQFHTLCPSNAKLLIYFQVHHVASYFYIFYLAVSIAQDIPLLLSLTHILPFPLTKPNPSFESY